ncbi:MAG TPA: anti-sigma factor [Bacillota bacterium]|nr:anti-sigma factor [Bacillota bacterium]HOH09478.1 anti-sigma factor [Bacillota bacterium]HQJ24159.1 anti-sigma factor [Bacillota bacterium]
MTCNKYERLLSAYLDRELTPEETAMVKRHIIGCAECAAVLEEYERVKCTLEELELVDVPDGLFDMGIIRARALTMEMEEADTAAGERRYGFFSFIGKALVPAALVGTLIAIPILQFVFRVDITGAIAGLLRKEETIGVADSGIEVVVPELNPYGYGSVQITEAATSSGGTYGWLTVGASSSGSDLILKIEDPRLSRYVQTFEGTGVTASQATYTRNW